MDLTITLIIVGLQVLTMVISVTGFLMVKFNDLKHLTKDVHELDKKIDKLQDDSDTKHGENKLNIKELSKIVTEIAKIQSQRIGICDTRHSVGKDN